MTVSRNNQDTPWGRFDQPNCSFLIKLNLLEVSLKNRTSIQKSHGRIPIPIAARCVSCCCRMASTAMSSLQCSPAKAPRHDCPPHRTAQQHPVGQNSSLTPHSCRSPYFYSFLFFFPLSVESYESAACFSLASFTECSLSAFLQQYFVSLLFGEYLLYVHTHTINNRSCGVEPASSG